jgi:hypothetical protein
MHLAVAQVFQLEEQSDLSWIQSMIAPYPEGSDLLIQSHKNFRLQLPYYLLN